MIEYQSTIKEFSDRLPKFPDGRIDYSESDSAPVLTCFVRNGEEILLLRRSDKVRAYQGKWNTVAGYLDDGKPLEMKAREELAEELGIKEDDIEKVIFGVPYELFDEDINKYWIIFPVLAELKKKPDIRLDWEHSEYRWISPDEFDQFDTVKGVPRSYQQMIAKIKPGL